MLQTYILFSSIRSQHLSCLLFHLRSCFSTLSIGIPKEVHLNEKRVAQTPQSVATLIQKGFQVNIEEGAGNYSSFKDQEYLNAGAKIVPTLDVWKNDIILKIRPPQSNLSLAVHEVDLINPTSTIISTIFPSQNKELVERLSETNATVFALDCMPRISRAQSFDVLSSMANISGYRAVIEAANYFGRFFTGQITAAGKVEPAKVLVIGGGVAGLSAVGAARSLGAIVRCFDTRSSVKEQVKSMGGQFLEVKTNEDGEGGGGYAKQMSAEFIKAEMDLFAKQCKEVDIIITTALIPGRKAPLLITKEMVNSMKSGSVIVDLAAENGGNVETTIPGELFISSNNVTCIGYFDFPSRLSSTASQLYSNNILKFLLYMITKENTINIDFEDVVLRSTIICKDKEILWPMPVLPETLKPDTVIKEKEKKEKGSAIKQEKSPFSSALQNSLITSGGVGGAILVGSFSPSPTFTSLLTTFGLACAAGEKAVWEVNPALHAPLMSVTNAISGVTAVGALVLMGGQIFPQTPSQIIAYASLFTSSVNIFGGFLVTSRMLDTFKRPNEQKSYEYLMLIPAATLMGSYFFARSIGSTEVHQMAYLASSLLCITSIGSLSNVKTSRMGNSLGIIGISSGIVTSLDYLSPSPALLAQMSGCIFGGAALGSYIANKTPLTALPQMVAAFHSLVGFAASGTAIASHLADMSGSGTDTTSMIKAGSILAANMIGAVTFTGSITAFLKLEGKINGSALSLPGKQYLNVAMVLANAGLGYIYMKDPTNVNLSLPALLGTSVISSLLGFHSTASIGGADMPVAITILNSYSGWALCAEGFILNNNLLTIVGSLVGSSGAILTHLMCKAMNRSIFNVLFGGFTSHKSKKAITRKQNANLTSVENVSDSISNSKKICIVPGYGLAVSRGHYDLAEMVNFLLENNIEVQFAIHPVAGRLPGQLNVILAEAGVDYNIVKTMEEVNDDFKEIDLTLVIGANDTINSSAEDDPDSPLAGMPVLRVWESKQVVIIKRTLGSGYSDSHNPVFYNDNTYMLLGDAKKVCEELKYSVIIKNSS